MTNEQKQEYNTFLENLNKAIVWLDNPNISLKKRETFAPRVEGLMKDMHVIAKKFKLDRFEMRFGMRVKKRRK